jgi:hypothetical protein
MRFPHATAVCLTLVTATSFIALTRVRAHTVVVQPFVGIQVAEAPPRQDGPPVPYTYLQTIAVRSDGSIARVDAGEHSVGSMQYSRDVIDASAKTHTSVEPVTESILVRPYGDIQAIGWRSCEKDIPAGQQQGFDVVYSEVTETLADGSAIRHREWKAPKLGCYPIVLEVTDIRQNGEQVGFAKQSLVHIHLGEPDPWYFAIPTNYTARTGEEWNALILRLRRR